MSGFREPVAAELEVGCAEVVQRWSPLNERQLTVLRRIDTGEDPVSAKNSELAMTVYALRNRGLVVTPRHEGVWRAEITDAGRFYLEHGHHPDRPEPGTASRAVPVSGARTAGTPLSARELIAHVQRAGGTLRVEDPDEGTRAAYRRAIHAAKRNGLVPDTMQLLHTGRSAGDLVIRLSNGGPEEETDWNRIRLGTRDKVSRRPDLIAMVEAQPGLLAVCDELRPRALRLIQDLSGHAERRGHRLALSRRRKPRGLFLQVGNDHQITVTISEETEERARELSDEERKKRGIYAWQRVAPEYETVFTGRLKIELGLSTHADKREWTDGRTLVDRKLGEILKTAERCVEREEQERLERQRQLDEQRARWERQETEKRTRWERAMAEARRLSTEDHRGRTLAAAFDGWTTAREIRALCGELQVVAAETDDPERAAELRHWIPWALGVADRLDPTRNPSVLSGFEFTPKADDLRPYLGDWSPEGPYREYRRTDEAPRDVNDPYREMSWFARRGHAQWWRR
ncbi:hypothetical protein [Actinomadura rupiterrae]|uniref:hypothetical protein n=1 Tax=Actinomadura rupiterrae TaxID=559627 RepID=UPI0020A46BB1|nr:hypothetical protein [Actinomadura rupiterrae]MCP2342991.1 hypothetical protein [Actinomadura rupiterrae]